MPLPRGTPKIARRVSGRLVAAPKMVMKVQITGLREFQKLFSEKNIEQRVINGVLKKAVTTATDLLMKRMRDIAKTQAGDGLDTTGRPRKHLWQTMTKRVKTYRRGRKDKKRVWIVGVAGPTIVPKGGAPHRFMVHDGTQPHEIPLPIGAIFDIPSYGRIKLPPGYVVDHPGAEPFPFVTMAATELQPRVNQIIRQEISSGLIRVLKT